MSQCGQNETCSPSRLKKRADFVRARSGTKVHEKAFVLQLIGSNDPDNSDLRAGFTVTKRVGNAVERNRIKRRLREALRQTSLPAALSGHDAVFVARREALDISFERLISDIQIAFGKALKKASPNPVAKAGRKGQNPQQEEAAGSAQAKPPQH